MMNEKIKTNEINEKKPEEKPLKKTGIRQRMALCAALLVGGTSVLSGGNYVEAANKTKDDTKIEELEKEKSIENLSKDEMLDGINYTIEQIDWLIDHLRDRKQSIDLYYMEGAITDKEREEYNDIIDKVIESLEKQRAMLETAKIMIEKAKSPHSMNAIYEKILKMIEKYYGKLEEFAKRKSEIDKKIEKNTTMTPEERKKMEKKNKAKEEEAEKIGKIIFNKDNGDKDSGTEKTSNEEGPSGVLSGL